MNDLANLCLDGTVPVPHPRGQPPTVVEAAAYRETWRAEMDRYLDYRAKVRCGTMEHPPGEGAIRECWFRRISSAAAPAAIRSFVQVGAAA